MRLRGGFHFLICCWKRMLHSLHHAPLQSHCPTSSWWRPLLQGIRSNCVASVLTWHSFSRLPFAHPSHVLQVAAAVANLQGISLSQVFSEYLISISSVAIYFSGPPCKSAQCDTNIWDLYLKLRRFLKDEPQLWERRLWCSVFDFGTLPKMHTFVGFWWIKDIHHIPLLHLFLTDHTDAV